MMENVKGLVTKKFLPFFLMWLGELESYGYVNFYKILNAKDYGVPQNRERIFVISILRTLEVSHPTFTFPSPRPLEISVEDVVENMVDDKFYLKKELVDKFIQLKDTEEYVKQYNEGSNTKDI